MRLIVALGLGFFIAVTPVAAANPAANLRLDPSRRYVYLTFTGLRGVTKYDYTLTYYTNSRQQGFVGGGRLKGKTVGTTRKQILGTCSGRRCVFHPNVKNLQLTATFTTSSGAKVNVNKSLQ